MLCLVCLFTVLVYLFSSFLYSLDFIALQIFFFIVSASEDEISMHLFIYLVYKVSLDFMEIIFDRMH